jgi:hypothetical protein
MPLQNLRQSVDECSDPLLGDEASNEEQGHPLLIFHFCRGERGTQIDTHWSDLHPFRIDPVAQRLIGEGLADDGQACNPTQSPAFEPTGEQRAQPEQITTVRSAEHLPTPGQHGQHSLRQDPVSVDQFSFAVLAPHCQELRQQQQRYQQNKPGLATKSRQNAALVGKVLPAFRGVTVSVNLDAIHDLVACRTGCVRGQQPHFETGHEPARQLVHERRCGMVVGPTRVGRRQDQQSGPRGFVQSDET